MQYFPFFMWHAPLDVSGAARFSLSASENFDAPTTDKGVDPLGSLRADVIIELSNRLTTASIEHPRLAPFLMEGLDNALEHLLFSRYERELCAVQQWLCEESRQETDWEIG